MNYPRKLINILTLALIMAASFALAEVPQLINYQGRLTDTAGDPVADATYLVKFIIYDAAAAGSEQWNSGFQTINTVNGQFEIFMGASPQPALPDNVFEDTTRYLGITVGTDPEISPRSRLVTVPYAYQALRADTASLAINANTAQYSVSAGFADECDLAYETEAFGGQEPPYYVNIPTTQTITGTKTFNDLNVSTTTRRISLSPAAFVPGSHSYQYSRNLHWLYNTSTNSQSYFAQVSLPDGAVITQLEGNFYDNDASYEVVITLYRNEPSTGSYYEMAIINTTGQPGNINLVNNSIVDATIDNELNYYVLTMNIRSSIGSSNIMFFNAEIEYTITKPLP